MIRHIVLFRPRAGLSADERSGLAAALRSAIKAIPSIRRARVGRRVKHGLPGYEQTMRQDFEYALIVEVDDIDALKRYLEAPAHDTLGDLFARATSAALAYDYALEELT